MSVHVELVDDFGGIAKVQLDGPHYNALSSTLLQKLITAFRDIASKFPKYGCVILTGARNNFSAGADIKEFDSLTAEENLKKREVFVDFLVNELPGYPIPIIAIVEGYCLGGGFELALACDFILASDTAKFGLPETKLGIIPGFGGTQRLTQIVGKYKSMELILTNRFITSTEAFQLNILHSNHKDVKDLNEAANNLAEKINEHSKYANEGARVAINQSLALSLRDGQEKENQFFEKLFDKRSSKL